MSERQTLGETVRIRSVVSHQIASVDAHRWVAETDQLRVQLGAAGHMFRTNLHGFLVHTARWAMCQRRSQHAGEEGRRGAERDG